ncbi:hypothetical protein [Candidimonas sp. SYP-B2681]|uniref:hypothetical protein n=1 Tax=Candidimonas sp. SYP-B2681 TaxID=2497686 RepID=UPI00131504F4|nr:hypothetical protein [Candidimonas sp. SYP-B2681]
MNDVFHGCPIFVLFEGAGGTVAARVVVHTGPHECIIDRRWVGWGERVRLLGAGGRRGW